ncbi:AP4M1 [Bugula neritina]|uniref:AP4M1 n=1 Tax=Bugula neritina TaxID=10212 RepID=A0A7J7KIX5_BUGNE|nr:AP4M1 [Bugula neritina]
MKKIDRVLCCSLVNHENLFDLDYNNKYSSREAQEFFQLFNETTGLAPFIHSKDLVFTQMSCDEVLFVLISKTETISATEKISLIQFLNSIIKVCRDFIGPLNVDTILTNITLFAEIIDCMLIGGYVHLTDTSKVKGFLSQSYVESKSPVAQSMISHPTLFKLSGSGYHPSTQSTVVPVSQSTKQFSKEEIYVDLIETLDFSTSSTGTTTCTVCGALSINNVSGSQKSVDFQLSAAYSKLIGQESFSAISDSQRFPTQGMLRVEAPPGRSQLMTYTLSTSEPPFSIEVKTNSNGGELISTVRCLVPASIRCLNVSVFFHLEQKPRGVLAIKTLPGQVLSIREEKQAIEWSIPEIMGQTHATAHFKVLPEGKGDVELSNPLSVSFTFEISNYLHSECKLSSVKVNNCKNVKKYIRHLSVAGDCVSKVLVLE